MLTVALLLLILVLVLGFTVHHIFLIGLVLVVLLAISEISKR